MAEKMQVIKSHCWDFALSIGHLHDLFTSLLDYNFVHNLASQRNEIGRLQLKDEQRLDLARNVRHFGVQYTQK